MKRNLIVVIVLLGCVLVLFALGVGVGLTRGVGDASVRPGESSLGALADLFGGRRALDLEDVEATGGAPVEGGPGVYRVEGELRLDVAERSTPMRLARLVVERGACTVDVIPNDENSVQIRARALGAGGTLDLNIPGKGARVDVTSAGDRPATLRVEPVEP